LTHFRLSVFADSWQPLQLGELLPERSYLICRRPVAWQAAGRCQGWQEVGQPLGVRLSIWVDLRAAVRLGRPAVHAPSVMATQPLVLIGTSPSEFQAKIM
jgi:hypothetical protein